MDKKNKPPKVNGINDVDTPEMARLRAEVIGQELTARSWKAYYEKMYYSLESEKLEAPYAEWKQRLEKKVEEHDARMKEFQAQLTKQIEEVNAENPAGEIELKEVPDATHSEV